MPSWSRILFSRSLQNCMARGRDSLRPPRADKTLPCRQTPISRRRTSGNTSTTSPRTAAAFGTTSSEASLSRAHGTHRLCAGRRPRDSPVSAANDRFCGGHAPRYCQGSAGTNNPEQRRDSPSVSGRLMALAMNTTSPWGRHLLAKRRGAVALAWAATLLATLLGGGAGWGRAAAMGTQRPRPTWIIHTH